MTDIEPETITRFDQISLSPEMQQTLRDIGYVSPTPVQSSVIPLALQGRDIIGQSQTGTGKTAAFLIPILETVTAEPALPQAIVLAPTRELIRQVHLEAERLCGDRAIGLAAIYGGAQMDRQIRQLRAGAKVVLGTPGRVIDLMRRGHLRTTSVRMVVLDEADRMLDIGFRPDIERILRNVPDERQTMLLSATMPPPVMRLTHRYMREPLFLNLSQDTISVDRIAQYYVSAADDRTKFALLLRLLVRERPSLCLIFCQRKVSVRELAGELGRRIRGVMAMCGDLPQSQRNRVMQSFRDRETRILVATDVVGRGIDIQGVSHVINFDIPEDPEAYVHRIGRTGRMGRDGKAFTFVTPEEGGLLTQIEICVNKMLEKDALSGAVYRRPPPTPLDRGVDGEAVGDAPSGPVKPKLDRHGRPIPQNRYRRGLGS